MERAPLRPVPSRPAGPVDPAAAIGEAAAALPALAPLEVRAFALVALADRPRGQVAGVLGIEEQELGDVLAAARKELRQTITPLAGSGWCERAEGLISDRLDGPLADRDARCLDVHLRSCPRCVEHERRLVQATDALLAGVAPLAPRPGPAVPPTELEVPPTSLLPVPVDESTARDEAAAQDEGVAQGEAAAQDEAAARDEAAAQDESAARGEALKGGAPDAAASAAGAPPSSGQVTAAAEVLVTARTRRQLAAAVTWNAMMAVALVLTIASIALIIAGILGAEL